MCHLGTMHICTTFHGNSSKGCQDISLNAKMSAWHCIEGEEKKNPLLTGVSVMDFMEVHHHTRRTYFSVDLYAGRTNREGE